MNVADRATLADRVLGIERYLWSGMVDRDSVGSPVRADDRAVPLCNRLIPVSERGDIRYHLLLSLSSL